jgi:hypothetical protein
MLLPCFTHFSSIIVRTGDSTQALSVCRHPPPSQGHRISMVERQHLEPHALGPLDASARHALDRPRRGSELMRRGLFESARFGSAGV